MTETETDSSLETGLPDIIKSKLIARLQWLVLAIFLIEKKDRLKISDVRHQAYDPHPPDAVDVIASADPDLALDFAKERFKQEEDRLSFINDKIRGLTTICAILIPLLSQFVVPRNNFGVVPLAFLLVALLILTISIGVGWRSFPGIPSASDKSEASRELAKSYLTSVRRNGPTTDFITDTYKAARRAFLLGLISLVVILAIPSDAQPSTVVLAPPSSKSTSISVPHQSINIPLPHTCSPPCAP